MESNCWYAYYPKVDLYSFNFIKYFNCLHHCNRKYTSKNFSYFTTFNIINRQKFNIKENSETWILFLSKDIDKINNVDIKYKHIYPYIFELQSSNSFQLLHLQAIIEKVLSSLTSCSS